MSKIFSFDLGTNSIGWAVVDLKDQKIIDTGVKIFQEGVVNLGDGSNELSRNSQRRGARGIRKQVFRRKLRKRILLKLLRHHHMAPAADDKAMHAWFKLNPYALRLKGIREKLTLLELGRVLYHLAQRRGFQSNSRSASIDIEKSKIYEGNAAEGKTGIEQTEKALEENHTLGEYLYKILPKENTPFISSEERVRNRYTTRRMYIDEFEKIWQEQQKHHEQLTDPLKEDIGGRQKDGYQKDGILFFQRELKSQKHLIGRCPFELTKTRIPVSALPFEKFRAWQFINSIMCNGHCLNEKQRQQAFDFLMANFEPKFSRLRKKIGLADSYYQCNYEDDVKCPGSYTISHLSSKKFFGSQWLNFTEKEQEDIWHILYFFDDKKKLQGYAQKHWGFDEEKAQKISKFNLKQGYASLSKKAVSNILPFLEQGFMYDKAVALGGIKNAFGSQWEEIGDSAKQLIFDYIPDIIASKNKGGYINPLKDFLSQNFNLTDQRLGKLYHHSANITTENTLASLPVDKEADHEIAKLRNPVVITALFELRKLVNTLIKTYGRPDQVNVELAREVKSTRQERNRIKLKQRKEEAFNDRIKKELAKLGQSDTHENILKYKLWLECQQTCPYTGKQIPVNQLFNGEVQIEHIFPLLRQ